MLKKLSIWTLEIILIFSVIALMSLFGSQRATKTINFFLPEKIHFNFEKGEGK